MEKIEDLRDLLIEEGRSLYNAQKQEMEELPNIEKQAGSEGLRRLIRRQIACCENQQKQIKEALGEFNANCEGGKCGITKIVLDSAQERINRSQESTVRDAGIINSLQKIGHRKIAGYGSAAAYARSIRQDNAVKAFHKALEDEKEIDKELSRLANEEINKQAAEMVA